MKIRNSKFKKFKIFKPRKEEYFPPFYFSTFTPVRTEILINICLYYDILG